jgi:hypothetical protein
MIGKTKIGPVILKIAGLGGRVGRQERSVLIGRVSF